MKIDDTGMQTKLREMLHGYLADGWLIREVSHTGSNWWREEVVVTLVPPPK